MKGRVRTGVEDYSVMLDFADLPKEIPTSQYPVSFPFLVLPSFYIGVNLADPTPAPAPAPGLDTLYHIADAPLWSTRYHLRLIPNDTRYERPLSLPPAVPPCLIYKSPDIFSPLSLSLFLLPRSYSLALLSHLLSTAVVSRYRAFIPPR